MGTDYGVGLAVGFILEEEAVLVCFRTQHIPEKFHFEDRFDTKTGTKLEPEKVVDYPGGSFYQIGDKIYDFDGLDETGQVPDRYDFLQALADTLECDIDKLGDQDDGPIEFSVRFKTDEQDAAEYGRLSVGGSLSFEEMVSLRGALDKLQERMVQMGLPSTPAKVFLSWSAG